MLVYRVPTEPASKRVAVWRDLKRMGALYLQQCVCILPDLPAVRDDLERVTTKIPEMEGEYTLFDVPLLADADATKIVAAFRLLRDKEYAEIIEECETKFVKEIEFEHFRQNYTFEEAEEIGQDLEKIRRWYARIVERDWFGASRREDVAVWIERCQELLNAFEHEVYARNSDDAPDASPPPIRGVMGLPVIGPVAPLKMKRSDRDKEKEKEMGA
ncbi:MAG TPA: Chromate resistance protein ChrB [Thermomicrobiales bacterium]